MTHSHPELEATARLFDNYAHAYHQAIKVLNDEWHTIDWHPSTTANDHITGGNPASPVENVLERIQKLEADYNQLDDDRRTIVSLVHSALHICRNIINRAEPVKPEIQRCNGKVNPECTNAADTHHDPYTGSDIEGMCSSCFLASCRLCHEHPALTSRKVTVEGRLQPGCERCWKREYRRARNPREHAQ